MSCDYDNAKIGEWWVLKDKCAFDDDARKNDIISQYLMAPFKVVALDGDGNVTRVELSYKAEQADFDDLFDDGAYDYDYIFGEEEIDRDWFVRAAVEETPTQDEKDLILDMLRAARCIQINGQYFNNYQELVSWVNKSTKEAEFKRRLAELNKKHEEAVAALQKEFK